MNKVTASCLLPLYLIGLVLGFIIRPVVNGFVGGFCYLDNKETARQTKVVNDHVEIRKKEFEENPLT